MDARRIAELEEEYSTGLVEDFARFKELLENSDEVEFPSAYGRQEMLALELSSDDCDSLWTVHCLFDTAPQLERKYKEVYGNDSLMRLYWAYSYCRDGSRYGQYLDRSFYLPLGDYYVTDPGYIVEGDDWQPSIWNGDSLADLGIPTSFMRDTIFGDWGCSLIDADSREVLGTFGADAGLVVVASVDEVLGYNPSFGQWAQDHPWCVAVVRDFEGDVVFRVSEVPYEEFGGGVDFELSLEFEGSDSDGRAVHLLAGMF